MKPNLPKPQPSPIPQTDPAELADAAAAQRAKFNAPGSRGRADTILFNTDPTTAKTGAASVLGLPGAS